MMTGLIGSVLAWRFHPATGAVLSLAGAALGAVLSLTPQWRDYANSWRAWVVAWSITALESTAARERPVTPGGRRHGSRDTRRTPTGRRWSRTR
jgi:hypothetical protein